MEAAFIGQVQKLPGASFIIHILVEGVLSKGINTVEKTMSFND